MNRPFFLLNDISYKSYNNMNNYIDFGRLPITESEPNDTLFGVREDGELIRCRYYINTQIDEKFDSTKTELSADIDGAYEDLNNQIKRVRQDCVDMLGEAVINLSKI